jgi:predicted transcriptional regulator
MVYNQAMRRTTIMADEVLLARLEEIARAEGKPLAEIIRQALRQRAEQPQPALRSMGIAAYDGEPVDWNAPLTPDPPAWR